MRTEAIKNKYLVKSDPEHKLSRHLYTINDKVVGYKAFYTELNAKIKKYMDNPSPKFVKVHSEANLEIWIELV